jgi:hypothetical protein
MKRIFPLVLLMAAACQDPAPAMDGAIADLASADAACLASTPPTMLYEDLCSDRQALCYVDHPPIDGY